MKWEFHIKICISGFSCKSRAISMWGSTLLHEREPQSPPLLIASSKVKPSLLPFTHACFTLSKVTFHVPQTCFICETSNEGFTGFVAFGFYFHVRWEILESWYVTCSHLCLKDNQSFPGKQIVGGESRSSY